MRDDVRIGQPELPVTWRVVVPEAVKAEVEQIAGGHHTLEMVLDWSLEQAPSRGVDAIITQDEFSLDVIIRFDAHLCLVFDVT